MARNNDVPSAADIFLKRKPVARRKPQAGLFDAVEVPAPEPPAPAAKVAVRAVVAETAVEAVAVDVAKVWTVADLVREVRGLIESRYARITVEGEISNWRPAASGHCYFTLKDGAAQLSVVMFRREAALVRFKPKDGDAVRLRGQVSVYESRGQMQLIAETMELAGIGAQLAAVQELKARLKREGLFENKRPLPAFPRCIGVVTSLQGAALRDIVKVCKRRHAAVNLLVYPAAVQGPRCAIEVAAGVRWFSAHPGRADVVIVARGGGSWEDLHGFDDERVARAIAASTVPVVVGVGHATDTTIADAAADVCAPTPSAAAELVTAAQHRVEERVRRLGERIVRAGGYELLRARQRLSRLSAEAVLRRLRDGLGRRAQQVDELEFRVQTSHERLMRVRAEKLTRLEARLRRQDVALRLAESKRRLERLRGRLERAGTAVVTLRLERVERVWARADAMNPLRVLERGYALVYGPGGGLLRSADTVEA
ncbi:MAG TPA: exodeoxyribonuclease VII large subunit, partial [Acidobacteriaceae bacterium]|nr:exodeoxyribonuclease VII large subunit [Acidobacteriaceae bacterium]